MTSSTNRVLENHWLVVQHWVTTSQDIDKDNDTAILLWHHTLFTCFQTITLNKFLSVYRQGIWPLLLSGTQKGNIQSPFFSPIASNFSCPSISSILFPYRVWTILPPIFIHTCSAMAISFWRRVYRWKCPSSHPYIVDQLLTPFSFALLDNMGIAVKPP